MPPGSRLRRCRQNGKTARLNLQLARPRGDQAPTFLFRFHSLAAFRDGTGNSWSRGPKAQRTHSSCGDCGRDSTSCHWPGALVTRQDSEICSLALRRSTMKLLTCFGCEIRSGNLNACRATASWSRWRSRVSLEPLEERGFARLSIRKFRHLGRNIWAIGK